MTYLFQGGTFRSAKQRINKRYDISTSGAVSLDLANGAFQRIAPTASTETVVISDTVSNLSDGTTVKLEIVQPSTGSCLVTWGSAFVWPSAAAPTLASTAGNIDVIDGIVTTISDTQYIVAKHVSSYAPPVSDTSITNVDAAKLGNPGTSANTTQYFQAASSSALDFDVDAAFSISFWLKLPNPHQQSLEFVMGKQDGASTYRGYEVYFSSGALFFGLVANAASTSTTARLQTTSTTLFNDEKWHHVGLVFVDTSTDPLIYVDGVSVATSWGTGTISNVAGQTISNSANLIVGGSPPYVGAGSYMLTGWIDEPSFWSKALSASEVADLFHAGSPTLAGSLSAMSNLEAWYRMGDDSSDDFTATTGQITDQTSNGYNLTPVGTTSSNEVTDVPERRSHWYKMNSGVSTPVPDSGKLGTPTLTIYGGPTNVVLGNNGGTEDCISFDGVNDGLYCQAGSSNVADLISYSFWLKLNTTPGSYDHFFSSSKLGFGSTGGGMGMYYVSSKLCFWTNNYSQFSSVTSPSTGTWHHIACCLDIANNTKKVYIDGSAGTDYSGTNVSPVYTFATDNRFAVGFLATGTTGVSYFGDCQISDFRIYNLCLDATSVGLIYNSGSGDWP